MVGKEYYVTSMSPPLQCSHALNDLESKAADSDRKYRNVLFHQNFTPIIPVTELFHLVFIRGALSMGTDLCISLCLHFPIPSPLLTLQDHLSHQALCELLKHCSLTFVPSRNAYHMHWFTATFYTIKWID